MYQNICNLSIYQHAIRPSYWEIDGRKMIHHPIITVGKKIGQDAIIAFGAVANHNFCSCFPFPIHLYNDFNWFLKIIGHWRNAIAFGNAHPCKLTVWAGKIFAQSIGSYFSKVVFQIFGYCK